MKWKKWYKQIAFGIAVNFLSLFGCGDSPTSPTKPKYGGFPIESIYDSTHTCYYDKNFPENIEMKIGEEFSYEFPEDVIVKNSDNKFVSFEGNKLIIKPWHVYNGEIKIETGQTNSYCKVSYSTNLVVNELIDEYGVEYVYYRPINENTVLVCDQSSETNEYCPFDVNEFAYLDARYRGIKKAISKVEELTGQTPKDEFKPIKIHLNASPNGLEGKDPYLYTKRYWDFEHMIGIFMGPHIYSFDYEWATLPEWPGYCLNLENPLEEPTEALETCQCVNNDEFPCNTIKRISRNYFKDPSQLEAQLIVTHEYVHAIDKLLIPRYLYTNFGTPYVRKNPIEEEMAESLSRIATNTNVTYSTNGNITGPIIFPKDTQNSFCYAGPNFWGDVCIKFNGKFSPETLLEFYFKLSQARVGKRENEENSVGDLKCAIDRAVGENSYDFFCSISTGVYSDCSDDPRDTFYVPREYCGD